MTTSNEATSTEETEFQPRSLDVLLKMSSYSEMSDDEIELVIEYRAQLLADDAERIARQKALNEQLDALKEQTRAAMENAQATAEKAFALVPEFAKVGNDEQETA